MASDGGMHLCFKAEANLDIVDSYQKFEDLLARENLFVDYFNAFLLSPVRLILKLNINIKNFFI